MALHKMVNGIKVTCTEEEEISITSDWKKNKQKSEEMGIIRKQNKQKINVSLEKIRVVAGLTQDEINELFKIA